MARTVVDPVVIPFAIVTPITATAAAPLTTQLAVIAGVLESIELVIPPGHGGLTGIRFALSGQQVLPWSNVAAWITADDYQHEFEIGVQVDTKLTALSYNTGQFPHTFYVRAKIRQRPVTGPPAVALIPNEAIGQ